MKLPQVNKSTLIIAAIVVAVVVLIYLAGRKAGKKAAGDLSWWEKAFGREAEEKQEIIFTGQDVWNPEQVADNIYSAHHSFVANTTTEEKAWAGFNALSTAQKVDVVNQWASKYQGTPVYGGALFGRYGTLRDLLEAQYSVFSRPNPFVSSLPKEQGKALDWMKLNNIE